MIYCKRGNYMNLTEELGAWRSLQSPLITIKVRFNGPQTAKVAQGVWIEEVCWRTRSTLKQCFSILPQREICSLFKEVMKPSGETSYTNINMCILSPPIIETCFSRKQLFNLDSLFLYISTNLCAPETKITNNSTAYIPRITQVEQTSLSLLSFHI